VAIVSWVRWRLTSILHRGQSETEWDAEGEPSDSGLKARRNALAELTPEQIRTACNLGEEPFGSAFLEREQAGTIFSGGRARKSDNLTAVIG
jgi:hypothetical protein